MNKNREFGNLFAAAVSVLLFAGCSAAPVTLQSGENSAPREAAAGTSFSKARITELYGNLPLLFVKNEGQVDDEVSYYQRSGGWSTWFTRNGIVLSGGETLEISFEGSSADPELVGEDLLGTKVNYLTGSDPALWRSGIPTFAAVRYRDVWPGIDLRFYGNGRRLEYDIIAQPGADPGMVRFLYRGADNLEVKENGDLEIILDDGAVTQRIPAIYQEVNGLRISVDGSFVADERAESDSGAAREFVLSFEVGVFDDRYALVVDPVILYSTYLGGSLGDAVNDITVDPAGHAYVSGYTESANFPVAGTPYQGGLAGGANDAFVAKFDAAGTALVYATYLGGTGSDAGNSVALDSSGNVYVTGKTDSADFPTFPAAPPLPIQPSHGGGQDAFVVKLDETGSALVYSTYLGGSGNDAGEDIRVDSGGNAFIVGGTASANFPLSASPYQDTHGGGAFDIFATKLNPDGTALVYSTFIGGDGNDYGFSIPFDESGNVFITGYTRSTDFPTTTGAYQEAGGGQDDAFVTKLNGAGSGLAYSTYLGGSGSDYGFDLAIDSMGNAYVTGETFSTDFPTLNPVQPGNGGNDDAIVTKLNSAGSALVYSTYLGGAESDYGEAIIVDDAGMAIITGDTWSSDFPTKNAFQGATGGSADAIVAQLNPSGQALVYSSYLGGSGQDYGWGGIAQCSMGCIYVAGATSSTDFPATPSALQGSSGGGRDGFVAKISPASVAGDWNGDGMPDILWRNYSNGADYLWYMGMTMGNHVMTGEASLPTVPVTSWRIEGHPDFNMDGMPDILWRNYQSGENYLWYMGMTMGNHVMTGGATLPSVTATSWRIGGTPDCNGDGVPDILWRNYSGGDNYVWYMGMTMGNPVVTGGASLPGVSSSDWWIDASDDMNGDGHPDILWRDYDTGANYVWFLDMTMGNPVVTGGAGLPAQPDVDWVIEGLSDMNGDGDPDILWRNYLNGANYLWYMGATMGSPVVTGGASLPTVSDWNWETGE